MNSKALTTLGHHPYFVIYSSKFSEDWWKVEGGVSAPRNTLFSLSLRYGDDCNSGKNLDRTTLNQISAQPCYSRYASS